MSKSVKPKAPPPSLPKQKQPIETCTVCATRPAFGREMARAVAAGEAPPNYSGFLYDIIDGSQDGKAIHAVRTLMVREGKLVGTVIYPIAGLANILEQMMLTVDNHPGAKAELESYLGVVAEEPHPAAREHMQRVADEIDTILGLAPEDTPEKEEEQAEPGPSGLVVPGGTS